MDAHRRSPQALVERFDELARLVPDATRRSMFGYPALTMQGHLFFSLHEDRAVLRLGPDDLADFTRRFGEQPFEPMPGRPMRGYVVIPPELLVGGEVDGWIDRAAENARSLPPKASARRSSKGAEE